MLKEKRELINLSLAEASTKIQTREISPVEIIDAFIERIHQVNPQLSAYISVYENEAQEVAKAAETLIMANNHLGPLHGIPISLKDNIPVKDFTTTAGSKVLEKWVPTEDATVVSKLKSSGSIIIGKNHMHEFAWGATSDNPYAIPRNPWDASKYAGGSSGGSGVAVAAKTCYGSLGTDTGGSVRLPAAFNGTVGIRPTIGRISNYGLIPLSWSTDTIGPMTRTVEDCAILFNALAGHDPKDSNSSTLSVPDYTNDLNKSIKGLRIGVMPNYFFDNVQESVLNAYKEALEKFEEMGASIEEIEIKNLGEDFIAQFIIGTCEPAAYHQKHLREQPENLGEDVVSGLEISEMTLATHYIQAQRYRSLLRNELMEAFKTVDVFISPTIPFTATTIGEPTVNINGIEQDMLAAITQFLRMPSLAGLPALNVPCGFDENNLPIGMQIFGKPFSEELLFKTGNAYQKETYFHKQSPKL